MKARTKFIWTSSPKPQCGVIPYVVARTDGNPDVSLAHGRSASERTRPHIGEHREAAKSLATSIGREIVGPPQKYGARARWTLNENDRLTIRRQRSWERRPDGRLAHRAFAYYGPRQVGYALSLGGRAFNACKGTRSLGIVHSLKGAVRLLVAHDLRERAGGAR